jgi:hypothetical protein
MGLHLCASCSRHVKSADLACPFCGSSSFANVPRPISRATRAALVFGGAVMVSGAVACSDDTSAAALYGVPSDAAAQEDVSAVALYGLPVDAMPPPTPSTDAAADAANDGSSGDAEPDVSPAPLYGAIPVDAGRRAPEE